MIYYSIDGKESYVKETQLMQSLLNYKGDLLQLKMDNHHLFNNISSESLPSALTTLSVYSPGRKVHPDNAIELTVINGFQNQ